MADPLVDSTSFGGEFLSLSREKLMKQDWPRLEASVQRLSPEQVWWRPNPHCNSVGNLLLHLDGNLRQWMLSGLGGAEDTRHRPGEFEAAEQPGLDVLLPRLKATLDAVDALLASLPPEQLNDTHTIQGKQVTALAAIYVVVEHFSLHLGQIFYIVKMLQDVDLGFFAHLNPKK